MKFNKLNKAVLPIFLGCILLQSCGKNDVDNSGTNKVTTVIPSKVIDDNDSLGHATERADAAEQNALEVVKKLQTEIVSMHQHPTLTLVLIPKDDIQASIKSLKKGGGKLIYDPNNGASSTVPFFIAELTPDQINNSEYMSSLNIKAASVENPETAIRPIKTKISSDSITPTNFIPTDSVNLPGLLIGGHTRENLGEGITVAVIDTGVDASHPGFNGRVSYWYDASQETRTKMHAVEASAEGEVTVNNRTFKMPANLPAGELFVSTINENKLLAQLSAESKESKPFLDLNLNKKGDEYLVVAVKTNDGVKVFFDTNASLDFGKKELISLINYNDTKQNNRDAGMVQFASRNSIVKYPLLLEQEGDDLFVGLGKTGGMHGTHVAGIMAANDPKNNLVGAAPKANIMALKVCTAISCTDSAIIKALYKTFYNEKGLIPDVVNISLGSHERYAKGVYSHIFDDLSAKFGTIFFVSASNSGPGFRSLNHIGNTGAVVMVGANVSKQTLQDQYNLPDGVNVQKENLLFFSSLGPSYTGEMKPNIVAPGAAISTVLTAEGYMSQANGTSMSSPLAAGTMAAILSTIKKDNKSLFNTIDSIRAKSLNRSLKANGSLLPYVYAMRDSLQQTATEQLNLTRAQQGYGLINAAKAKIELEKNLDLLNNKDKTYFEVVLNNYQEAYERKTVSKITKFGLSIGADGERPLSDLATIQAKGVDVILDRVEILHASGKVDVLGNSGLKYFHIIDQGNPNAKKVKTHVTFVNRRTKAFYSKRNLEAMEEGKTYLAHYRIMHNGAVVQNILDVVHSAFKMKESDISVPSIDPSIKSTKEGFAKKGISIPANNFHRYPIRVDSSMQFINVKVAIDPSMSGLLYVQLYDETGKEQSFETAVSNNIYPYSQANIRVPLIKNGKSKAGIWELTVSTGSSTWMSKSKYDLLVEADSFGTKKNKMAVKAGDLLEIPVQLDGNPISKVLMRNLKQLHKQDVKVKSGHFSFHPLVQGDSTEVSISINDSKGSYWGNIDHRLFVKENGKFVAFSGKFKSSDEDGVRSFTAIDKTAEILYFALDTITNYDLESSINTNRASTVEVITTYPKAITLAVDLSFTNHSDFDLGMVKIKSSIELGVVPKEGDTVSYITGELLIISGKVTSYVTAGGETITNIDASAKVNKVTIEFKQ